MKFLILVSTFLSSAAAFALPAQEYRCKGKDIYYQAPVDVVVRYSDWALEAGYSIQEATITTFEGGKSYTSVVDLSEKTKRDCPLFYNEISIIAGENRLLKIEMQRGCDAEVEYQIVGTCQKEY